MAKPGLPYCWAGQLGPRMALAMWEAGLPHCLRAQPGFGQELSWLNPGLPHCLWAQLPFPMALAMRKAGLPHCWLAQLGFRMALAIGKPCSSSAWLVQSEPRSAKLLLAERPLLSKPRAWKGGGGCREGPLAPPTNFPIHFTISGGRLAILALALVSVQASCLDLASWPGVGLLPLTPLRNPLFAWALGHLALPSSLSRLLAETRPSWPGVGFLPLTPSIVILCLAVLATTPWLWPWLLPCCPLLSLSLLCPLLGVFVPSWAREARVSGREWWEKLKERKLDPKWPTEDRTYLLKFTALSQTSFGMAA